MKPKDVKPKLCNPRSWSLLRSWCLAKWWSCILLWDVFPSGAELLTSDVLARDLSAEVHGSPHRAMHEAVLGIRAKNQTEKPAASVQPRADTLLQGGRRQQLLGIILSLGKHPRSWHCRTFEPCFQGTSGRFNYVPQQQWRGLSLWDRCGVKPTFSLTSILNYRSLIKTYSLEGQSSHQRCRVQGSAPAGVCSRWEANPRGTTSRESNRDLFSPIRAI